MFRTIFTTLRALLKSGLCATQLCIRSDTATNVKYLVALNDHFRDVNRDVISRFACLILYFDSLGPHHLLTLGKDGTDGV